MSEVLLGEIQIADNVKVTLWDKSRILAGDRYYVCLEARANVPYTMEDLDGMPYKEIAYSALQNLYGDSVPYVYRQEKHFVDKNEKDKVIRDFMNNLQSNKLRYLNHPQFRRKLIASTIRDLKNKRPQLFFSSDDG